MNGEMPLKLSNIIIKWQISHLDLEENMKFDKRFVFGAALVLGLGLNLSACGDDDKKDDEKPSDPPISEDSCKNGVLDAGEVCDTVDGKVVFAEGKGTCQLWYDENKDSETSPLVNDPEAVPGCAKTCMAHAKGTCKTEAAVLCGNGKIGELHGNAKEIKRRIEAGELDRGAHDIRQPGLARIEAQRDNRDAVI